MNSSVIASVENIINKYQGKLSYSNYPEIYFACVYLEHNGLNFRDEFVNYIEVLLILSILLCSYYFNL